MSIFRQLLMQKASEDKYFTVTIQTTDTSLTYGFRVQMAGLGQIMTIDWGDGDKEIVASNSSGIKTYFISHTYTTADIFKVKMTSTSTSTLWIGTYGLTATTTPTLTEGRAYADMVLDCNGNWSALNLEKRDRNGVFLYCRNATFASMKEVFPTPESDTIDFAAYVEMFNLCYRSELVINRLPDVIRALNSTFYDNGLAQIDIDAIVANAPADGWVGMTQCKAAFAYCDNATGSQAGFLLKVPPTAQFYNISSHSMSTYVFGGANKTQPIGSYANTYNIDVEIDGSNLTTQIVPTYSTVNTYGWVAVAWGDGNEEMIWQPTKSGTAISHTYASAGTYTIRLVGRLQSIALPEYVSDNGNTAALGEGCEVASWRNFATNPATWTGLNTAWSAMTNQDFEFEMEYIDFGWDTNRAVIDSYVQHFAYANSNTAYSGFVQYQLMASSVTGTHSGGFVYTGIFAVAYAKSAYPKTQRHKLNAKLSVADNTITTTIDGVSTVGTPVLRDSWFIPNGQSNFNGHIFSMILKDGNGDVVWEAPVEELRPVIPLTFTAQQANSTVALNTNGSLTIPEMHYRLGTSGDWLPYTAGTTIELGSIGDKVQFWNNSTVLSTSRSNYAKFAIANGKVAASGNIQSLLNWSTSVPLYGFAFLFQYAVNLVSLPDMPATQLTIASYYAMYQGCTNLAGKVVLPAAVITEATYYGMFESAKSITSVEIDGSNGIRYANNALGAAFSGCSSLNTIKVKFTSWAADKSGGDSNWTNWVNGVSATGTFYKPSALPEEYGTNRIPSGWTVVNID